MREEKKTQSVRFVLLMTTPLDGRRVENVVVVIVVVIVRSL
jgi:hypothetical protein